VFIAEPVCADGHGALDERDGFGATATTAKRRWNSFRRSTQSL
jgi:hypothetical protein